MPITHVGPKIGYMSAASRWGIFYVAQDGEEQGWGGGGRLGLHFDENEVGFLRQHVCRLFLLAPRFADAFRGGVARGVER